MFKKIFHEFFSTRIIHNFATWIIDDGYKDEGNAILLTMLSWEHKYIKRLTQERQI